MYKKVFEIKAEWHFFAKSHGKNACDRVGRTLKRLAAHASLQRAIHDQILNPHQLYDFGKREIPCITRFLLISSKLMLRQNFWPPDMKMPDNLEEAEKTISFFPMVTIF